MSAPIVIAGAGIGGLTAALCLARAGHAVTILERRERLEEVGAGLQISPNASRVLASLGLGPALEKAGVPARMLLVRRFSTATPIATMPLDGLARRYGSPYWLLRRADLQQVLAEAVARIPAITLRCGESVTGAEASDDMIALAGTSANGETTRHEAALAVGADGLWSTLSHGLHPHEAAPSFTGYEAWRALLPAGDVPAALGGPDVALWLGVGAHVVCYPVAGGDFLNIVLARRGASAHPGWTRPGDAALLKPLLADAAPNLRRLLERVAEWQVWSLFDAPAQGMAGNRLALLGDAAHPVLPFLAQGAALAIEDAAVLTRLLPPDTLADRTALQRALQRYDRARRPRAARVQQAARSNGRAYHLGWPAAAARDTVMSLLGGDGLMRRYDWLYGWRHQEF